MIYGSGPGIEQPGIVCSEITGKEFAGVNSQSDRLRREYRRGICHREDHWKQRKIAGRDSHRGDHRICGEEVPRESADIGSDLKKEEVADLR